MSGTTNICEGCRTEVPPGARFCPSCARPTGTVPHEDGADTMVDTPSGPTEVSFAAGDSREMFTPGTLIDGKYEVREKLGTGGFGDVYKVHHQILKRDLALKTLHPLLVHDVRIRERFFREARVLMDLSHPNIVTMRDVGEWKGLLYLVMDFCPGETLHSVLKRRGRLSAPTVAALALPVLRALDYAHGKRVVHRDLKPANLIITPLTGSTGAKGKSDVKVLDFGVAKVLTEDAGKEGEGGVLTGTGMAIGTLHYMSPEQAGGSTSEIDGRADLYSLGALLYESVAGRRPFDAENNTQVYRKILMDPPPPIGDAKVQEELPGFEALVLACLSKEPKARPQNAREMHQRLDDLLKARTSASSVTISKALGDTSAAGRAQQAVVAVAIAATLLVGVGIVGLALGWFSGKPVRTANQGAANTPGLGNVAVDAPANTEPTPANAVSPANTNPTTDPSRYLDNAGYLVDGENPVFPADLPDRFGEAAKKFNAAVAGFVASPNQSFDTLQQLANSSDDGVSSWAMAAAVVAQLRAGSWPQARDQLGRLDTRHPDSPIAQSMRQLVKAWVEARDRKLWEQTRTEAANLIPKGEIPAHQTPYAAAKKVVRTFLANRKLTPIQPEVEAFLADLEKRETEAVAQAFAEALALAQQKAEAKDWPAAVIAAARALGFRPDDKGALELKTQADAKAGNLVFTAQHPPEVRSVACSPDGKYVLSGGADKTLRLWDAATGKEVRSFTGHTGAVTVARFGRKRMNFVASASTDGTLRMWDFESGKEDRKIAAHEKEILCLAVSQDRPFAATGSADKTLKIWNIHTLELEHTLNFHSAPVVAAAFGPDGRIVASAGADRTLRIFDVVAGRLRPGAHAIPVSPTCITFLVDGRNLLVGDVQGGIALLVFPAGTVQRHLDAHARDQKGMAVRDIAVSPDEKSFASCGDDGLVKLWDASTWKPIASFAGHSGGVRSVAFSADGKLLASGGEDGTVRLWRLP